MIKRWYEISCDYCGTAITHLPYKPDEAELAELGCEFIGRKLFCSKDCKADYSHDHEVNKRLNLKQYQRK